MSTRRPLGAGWWRGGPSGSAVTDTTQETAPATDARLLGAMRHLPIGVVLGSPDGDIVYRNEFADSFTQGRHSDALIDGALRELLAAANEGRNEERSLELYGPPSSALELRSSTFVQNDVTLPMVIIEDVSAEHRVDRVRRDFVANVSHELKTPVGALSVLAETLRSHLDDGETVDRLSARIQQEAMRLGRIVDDLLELSWLDSGQVTNPERVDAASVVADAVARCRSVAEQRQVELELDQTDGCAVLGDRRQITAAVANVVENAVKYSEVGTSVSIGLRCEGPDVIFEVADRGVGIPAADLERIFERFYRADLARSRATGGTGLGLAIVRNAVQNHGGRVDVRSVEGEGSTFTLRLPSATSVTKVAARGG